MTRIKICGLTRREDLEAAISLGADAVGFVFEPSSKRALSLGKAPKLLEGLPPFVTRVGVFGPLRQEAPFSLLDAIQAVVFSFPPPHGRRIQVVRPRAHSTVQEVVEWASAADALLLDAFSEKGWGGSGEKTDWGLAAEVVAACQKPVILAGGLTPENVAAAVRKVQPYAVDVSSSVESAPGIKDRERMRRFIDAVKNA